MMIMKLISRFFPALCLILFLGTGCGHFGTVPMGEIHGRSIELAQEGEGSSLQPVTVRGIVHQTLMFSAAGSPDYYAFAIQNTEKRSDKDPKTSDGLHIGMGTNNYIQTTAGGHYRPRVGDEVTLNGIIIADQKQTVLQQPVFKALLQTGLNVDEVLPSFVANPPVKESDAELYWRRHEGMRCLIPAGSVVAGGHRDEYGSMIRLVNPGHKIAARRNVYARRPFRDAHPLDDERARFDNGNGYMIAVGPMGLIAEASDLNAALPAVSTFETLKAPVMGAVCRYQGQYMVQVDQTPEFERTTDPAANRPETKERGDNVLAIATYNIENLYDFRDDPFDNRDFYDGRASTPVIDENGKRDMTQGMVIHGYVPASQAAYEHKLAGLAAQIIHDLEMPDIIMVQELEDQDIGTVQDGKFVAGDINNRDGLPDVLQELVLEIEKQGGSSYAVAGDRDSADYRGIVTAFLYKPERVSLSEIDPAHSVLGEATDIAADGRPLTFKFAAENPKSFNILNEDLKQVFARGPLVAGFDFEVDGEVNRIYLLNNHFKSRPQSYVDIRKAQAKFNGDIVRALRKDEKGIYVLVGGDLNTFPRPDEPDPFQPADQLGSLYDANLVNLYDEMLEALPENAYSYVYKGQAQTLDHMFVTKNLGKKLQDVHALHINSDYVLDDKYPRRAYSDHDPILAYFKF